MTPTKNNPQKVHVSIDLLDPVAATEEELSNKASPNPNPNPNPYPNATPTPTPTPNPNPNPNPHQEYMAPSAMVDNADEVKALTLTSITLTPTPSLNL